MEYTVLIAVATAALAVMVSYIQRAFYSNVNALYDHASPEPAPDEE